MLLYTLFYFLILQLLFYLPAATQHIPITSTDNRICIAFGSCNNQFNEQPLWSEIIASDPDVWVWLGDNIYADTDNMDQMAAYYQHQLQRRDYQQLLQNVPITGIWSDHDFAGDNANKNFPYKKQSQQLFLDFMGIAKDDSLRQQEGIYRSYMLSEGDRKVKLILLDGLYHRDPYVIFLGMYLPYGPNDVLGEEQWKWLEGKLTNSDANVHIIASGLQVLPTGSAYTNWSAFPTARERLLRLLEKTRPAVPIVISGDRHVGELSKIMLKGYEHPLFEITSSGMTHYREARRSGNRYRVGNQVGALNFGLLHIFWGDAYTSVTMQIRGVDNKLYLQETYNYPVQANKLP